jgi:hypothetical protein
MKEFKVNEFLSLKLENNETVIYVKGEKFSICKHLVLNIPIDKISSFSEITSIDEVADKTVGQELKIPPETVFWGHCSNLQVWYENDYNTKLLHRNLAFPLLKKLGELGDIKAKRVFKEEIAKRFSSGHEATAKYLYKEGYLQPLNTEELETIIRTCIENNKLRNLCQRIILEKIRRQFQGIENVGYYTEDDKIIELSISRQASHKIKDSKDIFCLPYLTDLKYLSLSNFEKVNLCDFVTLKSLEHLNIMLCHIKEIKCLNSLNQLKTLELNHNQINEIEGIENLKKLEKLSLISNQIEEIKNLDDLTSLKELNLANNKITVLKGINKLTSLKKLRLDNNEVSELEELTNLNSLEYLNLSINKIEDISKLTTLSSLKDLNLSYNKIKNIDPLKMLKKLKHIDLSYNDISESKINEFKRKKE